MASPTPPARRLLLAFGLGAVILLLAEVALRVVVDASFVAARVERALGPKWNLEIGAARATLVGRRLEVRDVCLERAGGLALTVDRISFEGLDPWTAVVHRGLKLGRLAITSPTLALPPADSPPAGQRTAPPTATGLAGKLDTLPPLSTRRLEITGAALRLPPPDDDGGLAGIRMVADDVDVASATLDAADRTLFCREIEVTAPPNQWQQGRYLWTLGPLRFSTRDSTVAIDSLAVVSAMTDSAFAASHTYRTDRYDLAVGPLRARLAGWRAWPGPPQVQVRSLHLAQLWVGVLNDATLPRRPDRPPARMPHEQLRDLGVAFAIDTLRIGGGAVRYRERPATGGEPGELHFTDLAATITGLANHPAFAPAGRPAVFVIASRLFGAAPLSVRWEYDLLADALDLDASGTLGSLPAAAFDAVLSPLEGIRFREGTLDSLRFAMHLGPAQAGGDVGVRFQALALAASSRGQGKGPLPGLEVGVANLLLQSDAAAGTDSLLTYPIDYARQPYDAFFKYLWAGLRSGLLRSLGL